MKKVFFLVILIAITSCSTKVLKENYVVSYNELPQTVQSDFSKIGNTVNLFMAIENTDKNCKTTIESGSPIQAILPKAYLIIETCQEKYKVDFSISAARYFVVDNKKIFFIKSNGFSQKGDAPLNESLDLKKINYGVINLDKQ
ncbi:hypothetical protein [uncultured Chryseobacterium sp.]|jgi:hypothetical protein|uniref:hypothetical protein n=1 Tax=uncultured Chryseobacterium sp. TaxID=259322 RepID=UPI00261A24BB|nr:hypothetical protein [uncultured Chryseobacterium sp.]